MKFCTNCGARLEDDAKFCTECGQQMETPAAQQQAPHNQEETAARRETPVVPDFNPPERPVIHNDPEIREIIHDSAQRAPETTSWDRPQQQTPPAGTYAPPQQPQTPPAGGYAPPQQQQPTPPAGGYAPPRQQTPPAGGGYVPPQQPPVPPMGGYTPPQQPPQAPKGKPGNKKIVLFAAIGAAVVILAVVLILVFTLGGKKSPYAGKYLGISCTMDGVELGAEDEWVELKKKDKIILHVIDDDFTGKWTLNGDRLTVEQGGDKFTGTLKDGVLTLNISGMKYTFQKESDVGKPTAKPNGKSTEATLRPGKGNKVAGYWTLLYAEMEDGTSVLSEKDAEDYRDLGVEFFLDLHEDGTGAFVTAGTGMELYWDEDEFTIEDEECDYVIEDGQLTMEVEGTLFVYVPGEGSVPDYVLASDQECDYYWWDGDWYGWWIVADASDNLEDTIGIAYDCCAEIDVEDDGTGSVQIYDVLCDRGEYIVDAEVSFTDNYSPTGYMVSESGTIFDEELEYLDWLVDPEDSPVSEIDNMICIEGTTFFGEDDDEGWIDYMFFLRPWSMDWEDVRDMDTSDMPYSDMMPVSYDDWYVPLMEDWADMPDYMDVP